jgi:hypothetical protein
MSFYDILSPPNKDWANLYVNSISSNVPISIPDTTFAATLATGTSLVVPSGLNYAGTFVTGMTGSAQSDNNIDNTNFDYATGIFTVPVTGDWHLESGVLYSGLSNATGPYQVVVGVAPPGNTSDPYVTSILPVPGGTGISSNISTQASRTVALAEGTELQMYTQQNSSASYTFSGASNYYVFFSGFLVPS